MATLSKNYFFGHLIVFICLLVLSGCGDSPNSPDQGIGELIPIPPMDELAVWNPKSDWIAYEHTNSGWGDTDTSGVYLIRCDGTSKQLLVAWGQGPAWDSTGNVLAFTHYTGLWLYDFQSLQYTQLLALRGLSNPSFSFDGARISLIQNGELRIYDVAGDSAFAVLDSAGHTITAFFAQWRPGHPELAIAGWRNGYSLWLHNWVTRDPSDIAQYGRYPRWSPDGTKLCFFGEFGPPTIIFDLINRDSLGNDLIFKSNFGPSGSQLVGTKLVGDRADPYTLRFRLFIFDLDTHLLRQLTY